MERLLDFLREWYDIKRERKAYCKSCETLREQLALANHEKKQLLEHFLNPTVTTSAPPVSLPEPITPKIVPWHIKRQMLEAEDRAKAAVIRKQKEDEELAKKRAPSAEISVEELEKELGVE